MRKLLAIALLAAVAALAAGCCACRSYQKKTRRPLVGTQWQLVRLGGTTVQPEADAFTIRLQGSDSTLAGTGACNRLSGRYEEGENRKLHIGPVASTRMACPNAAREQAFIAALESTTHYDMDGPMLLLLSDGELRAVFQALPDEPAAGTK